MTSRFSTLFLTTSVVLALLGGGLSCSSSESGIRVSLSAVHYSAADADGSITALGAGESRTFTNNLGFEITLTSGSVTLSSVMIHDCDHAGIGSRILRRLSPIPAAYAHSEGSATELGVPSVIDLLGADLTGIPLGELEPPAGSYCHLMVTVAPADEDAQFLPASGEMVGKSFAFAGTFSASAGGSPQAFTIESTSETTVETHFLNGAGEESPLELASSEPERSVAVGVTLEDLFVDVDLGTMSSAEVSEKVLANLSGAIHHYTGTYTAAD